MIRVLHLITTLESGGAQAMLANLVTGKNSGRGVAHAVVEMTAGGEYGERIQQCGIALHSLGMTRGRTSAAAAGRFVQLLRRERPSIVQTWLYHADLLGLLTVPVLRVPVVWNVRCAWHVGIDGFAPRMCARLSRLPAAVVVNSRAGEAVHRGVGYRPRRWCLIPNGFDLGVFRPDELARVRVRAELGLPADAILIGIIGRWDPNKDHATFLAAAAVLSRQRGDVHFVLAGEGLSSGNAAVSALIGADPQLPQRVHLLGRRADVSAVTAALDIASCTSIGEGFPNVVGEAMAAAVPCVSTDVGDAAQLVGDAQLIVPTRNPAALAAVWSRLLSMDRAALRAKGMVGRARICQHYSLSSVISQYESLYAELQLAAQRPVR